MRMGSLDWTARWMRATATFMPSMSMGSMRSSMVGLRKAWAAAGSDMPRESRRLAMAFGQSRSSARRATAAGSTVGISHCCGPAWAEDMVRLLVTLAVIDHNATEVGHCLHQILEAVVPVGGDLHYEHDSLVGEAKLEIADLADVVDEILGVVDLFRGFGEGFVAKLVERDGDIGFLENDLAHGDERRAGGFGVFDKVLPAAWVFFLQVDGGGLFAVVR